MKKIKFNQPKFIIPLLLLPFLFLGFYFFKTFSENNKNNTDLVEVDGINSNIPEASLNTKTKGKLEEFREALSKRRRNSGVEGIESEGVTGLEDEDSLTVVDNSQDLLNEGQSMRDKLKELAQKRINSSRNSNQNSVRRNSSLNRSPSRNTQRSRNSSSNNDEMEDFKKQMMIIDSISNPGRYKQKKDALNKRKLDSLIRAQRKAETFKISKTPGNQENYFNTIKANRNETFISAILDEGIKIYKDSRVRIRIMDDIFINDKLFPKGHYLYGTVTNFEAQRVVIHISSVIINDEILPVDISLYDNDGMEGIYVPNTMFKQFAKELGVQTANNAGSTNLEDDNSKSNILFEGVSTAVRTSTRAIQKALQSNKVRVKYSHKVYLVNNDN